MRSRGRSREEGPEFGLVLKDDGFGLVHEILGSKSIIIIVREPVTRVCVADVEIGRKLDLCWRLGQTPES